MLSGLGGREEGRNGLAKKVHQKFGSLTVLLVSSGAGVIDLPTVKAYSMLGFLDLVVVFFFLFLLNIISVGV